MGRGKADTRREGQRDVDKNVSVRTKERKREAADKEHLEGLPRGRGVKVKGREQRLIKECQEK